MVLGSTEQLSCSDKRLCTILKTSNVCRMIFSTGVENTEKALSPSLVGSRPHVCYIHICNVSGMGESNGH